MRIDTVSNLSLSARRAWIEISIDDLEPSITRKVALRKESVDRNHIGNAATTLPSMSLSARRAWIEMIFLLSLRSLQRVALRKESVDRNTKKSVSYSTVGLSLSARRAWIEIE